jgi:hypothetical protein
MQPKACNNGPHESDSSLPTALQLVTALTENQHQRLLAHAAKRMRRLLSVPEMERCLARKSPDDIVHDSLQKVLLGESHQKEGRKLSLKGRQSTDDFLAFVQGIINSDVSNTVRSCEVSFPHISLGDPETEPGTVEVPEPFDFARLVELRDLKRELFARLELVLQNEPALTPVIRHWSELFYVADRIAGPEFDPNLVYRVRQHSRRIFRELVVEIQPGEVTGLEMLL